MTLWSGTLMVMVYRQLKRFIRARSRVVGSIVNPLIWLGLFGIGWSSFFRGRLLPGLPNGASYLGFLAPGVVIMSTFIGGFIAGITVIWDKEFGFLKELLVAPASRAAGIVGRAIGDALSATLQGAIVLVGAIFLVSGLNPLGAPLALLAAFLTSLVFTGLGILVALKISSMEGFHLLVSLIMMPVMFLSDIFYPLGPLPSWMKAIAMMNPLTYAVDLARAGLAGAGEISPEISLVALIMISIVLLAADAKVFEKTTIS